MEARFDNLLYFPFGFAIDNVRWGTFVIRAVGFGFAITGQKVNVCYAQVLSVVGVGSL